MNERVVKYYFDNRLPVSVECFLATINDMALQNDTVETR